MKGKLKAGVVVVLNPASTLDEQFVSEYGPLEAINLVVKHSFGMSCRNDGLYLEFREKHEKDGKVDGRRSRYYANGKRVGRDAFNVLMWGKK